MRHSGIDDWYMCELFKKEGDSYYVLGQWAQAANSYSQSLRYFNAGASAYQELGKDRESDSHFDPNDDAVVLDTTLMRSRLGDCYSILAEQPGVDTKQMLTTAENLYFRSLNSWRKLRGDFSGDEMVTIYRLAHVQARLGHTSSARTFYKEALDHCIKIYGAKNVYTGLLLRDYADFLWHSNSWLEALYYRVWSLTILASAK
jgi:tetratricopeptide (TPR) repeat protein